MALDALSSTLSPGSERESADGLSQRQFHGLVALGIGLSQLPVALRFASDSHLVLLTLFTIAVVLAAVAAVAFG